MLSLNAFTRALWYCVCISEFECKTEGFFPHKKSCKKYYWCLEAAGLGMVAHTFTCPTGLYFSTLTDGCDFRRNVDCGDKVSLVHSCEYMVLF